MERLKGQRCIVTGGSGGIGRAIASELARAGADLCLVGRRATALEEAANALRKQGGDVRHVPADLSRDEDLHALIPRLLELARVDILVHSAGVFSMGPWETAPVEDLDRQYRVNVRAPYVITQALLPMLKASRGQVGFVNSSAAVAARGRWGPYAATKSALKALADSLRDEVNADGVRVISIYPGRTATPMQASVHATEGRAYQPEKLMQPEDVAKVVVEALLLPRTAEVTDVHVRPMLKT